MGSTTTRLALYKPAPGDAAATYDTEFPANMDTLDNAQLITVLTTDGDLYVKSGSDVTRLAAGTAGQVLTANGVGSLPTYQTPGAAAHPDFFEHDLYGTD